MSSKSSDTHRSFRNSTSSSGLHAPATPGPSRQHPPTASARCRPNTSAGHPSGSVPRPQQLLPFSLNQSQGSSRSTSLGPNGPLRRLNTPAPSTASGRLSRAASRAASSIGASEGQQIICAVSEARGVSPSVGVAFINVTTGKAVLSQICDNQSYVNTMHKLTVFEPSRLLIVSTACPPNPQSSLYATISEELPTAQIVPLDRKYWSETAGLEYIQTLAFKADVEAIKVAIHGNFYATCALSAVCSSTDFARFSRPNCSHTDLKSSPGHEVSRIGVFGQNRAACPPNRIPTF